MCELDQFISYPSHRGHDRHYTAALALRLENSLRHVTNSFRCPNGSAAIFLNHQAHVEMETNRNKTRTAILFEVGYSSIARRTSTAAAAIGFNSLICPIITSGSFKPCPVTVQTIRLASRIFWNEYAASAESQHLKKPAIDAALAGSTKIPSCCASHLCAARMSSSLTTSIPPCDSTMAARACCQLAGFPIRIAEAIVSGLPIMRS